jgi:hypothetical protein
VDKDLSSVDDPAIVEALTRVLGHGPPFSVKESREFDGVLTISGARDLSVLGHFPALTGLDLFGSDLTALDALTSMRDLRSLRVVACPIADLDPLRGLSLLETLELNFTFVEDVAPILELPALHRVRLMGNPLTQSSYDLANAVLKGPAKPGRRRFAYQITVAQQWKLGRMMREQHIDLCFSSVDPWVQMLVKPGTGWERSHWSSIGGLLPIINGGEASVESLLAAYRTSTDPPSRALLKSGRELGDSIDAGLWIKQAALSSNDASALQSLVAGFGDLVFCRDGETFLTYVEGTEEIKLPDWFRQTRGALGFVCPGEPVRVRLTGREEQEYRFDLVGYDGAESGPKIRDRGLFPVAIADDRSSTLCISTDGPDRRVHELSEAWLGDDTHPLGGTWVAYPSYADLVSEIAAVRRADKTVIQRSR